MRAAPSRWGFRVPGALRKRRNNMREMKERMGSMTKNAPRCFGLFRSPQHDAEACCRDCPQDAACRLALDSEVFTPLQRPTSWAVHLFLHGKWYGNKVRLAVPHQATRYGDHVAWQMGDVPSRVVQTHDPVTHYFSDVCDLVRLERMGVTS
jgi:hypothetical protein